jgi:hypothetical protein
MHAALRLSLRRWNYQNISLHIFHKFIQRSRDGASLSIFCQFFFYKNGESMQIHICWSDNPRDCDTYQDFLIRGLLLTRKLLNQRFLLVWLKSSLRKFYDRHYDLVIRYGIYVSQMTTDMFHLFTPVLVGVRVAWSLVFCVEFCRSLFAPFSFGHCVVSPSIYGSW